MNYKVSLAPKAQDDLRSIYEYITVNLQSVQNAEGQSKRLIKAVNSLSYLPERFRKCDNELWESRNLRIMNVDNYKIFYITDNEANTVTVLRIIYGRRNIEELFNQSKF